MFWEHYILLKFWPLKKHWALEHLSWESRCQKPFPSPQKWVFLDPTVYELGEIMSYSPFISLLPPSFPQEQTTSGNLWKCIYQFVMSFSLWVVQDFRFSVWCQCSWLTFIVKPQMLDIQPVSTDCRATAFPGEQPPPALTSTANSNAVPASSLSLPSVSRRGAWPRYSPVWDRSQPPSGVQLDQLGSHTSEKPMNATVGKLGFTGQGGFVCPL